MLVMACLSFKVAYDCDIVFQPIAAKNKENKIIQVVLYCFR